MEYMLKNLVNTIMRLIVDAAWMERKLMTMEDHEWRDVDITFHVKVKEAGVYDWAPDAIGMNVGEGWIGHGYPEFVLSGITLNK